MLEAKPQFNGNDATPDYMKSLEREAMTPFYFNDNVKVLGLNYIESIIKKALETQKKEIIEDMGNLFLCKSCRKKNEKIFNKYNLF